MMFYRDFILTVDRQDRMHFMTQLVTLIHENFSRLQCALAFPGWTPAEPNPVDSFDTFTRYADVGDVIRLFAEDETVLAAAERILGIEVLLQRRVLLSMPAKPAPSGCRSAAFCRVRSADSLGRRVRRTADSRARERMKDKVRARCHEMAYFRMTDREGRNARPLFFEKVCGEEASPKLETNSYGLSAGQTPCFLPDF
jgi:hypothetical protein